MVELTQGEWDKLLAENEIRWSAPDSNELITFKLVDDGSNGFDLDINRLNQLNEVTFIDSLEQSIKIILHTQRHEDALNPTSGFDRHKLIGVQYSKTTAPVIEQIIKTGLDSVVAQLNVDENGNPDVLIYGYDSVDVSFDSNVRKLTFSCRFISKFGAINIQTTI